MISLFTWMIIILVAIIAVVVLVLYLTNDNKDDDKEKDIKELEQILLGGDYSERGTEAPFTILTPEQAGIIIPNRRISSEEPFLEEGQVLDTTLLADGTDIDSGIDYGTKYEFVDSANKEKGEVIFIQGVASDNDKMSILFQRNDVVLINVISSFTKNENGVITLTGTFLTPWSVYDNSFISGIFSTAIQAVTINFTTQINGSNVLETVTFSKNIVKSSFVNLIKFNLRNQIFITDPLTADITLPKDLHIPLTSDFNAVRNKAKAFETKAINSFNNKCTNRTLVDYSSVDLGILKTMDISGLKIQSINIDTSSTATLIKLNVVFADVSQLKLKINSTEPADGAIEYNVKCGDKEFKPYQTLCYTCKENNDCTQWRDDAPNSCAPICSPGVPCTKYRETGQILNETDESLFKCDLMDTSVSSSGPVVTFDMTIDVSTITNVSVTKIDNFTVLNGNVLTSSTTSGCTNILANDTLKNLFNDNVLASAYGNNFGNGQIRNDMSGVLSTFFDGAAFKGLLSSGINRGTK